MFGLAKGGCHLTPTNRKQWQGHICGLCLTLRDHQGQLARMATNYDAALISVLCEAQTAEPAATYAQTCVLRGFQRAHVVAASNPGAQYAAALALTMAATRLDDHVADGDTQWRHMPGLAKAVAGKWQTSGHHLGKRLQFNSQALATQATRQTAVEQQPNRNFAYYAEPTELAVAAAFQHTAVIAHQLQNLDPLYEMGRMYGRILFLLDSYRDYADDLAQGKFNALAQAFASADRHAEAQRIFREAHNCLKHQFNRLILPQPELAQKLLVEQLAITGRQTLGHASCTGGQCTTQHILEELPEAEQHPPDSLQPAKKRGFWGRPIDDISRCNGDCCDCCDCCDCLYCCHCRDCNCGCCHAHCCEGGHCCDCDIGCCECGTGCCDCSGNCCDCNSDCCDGCDCDCN